MVSTVGPVSNRYPSTASWPMRPPGPSARSSTVTCRPVPASRRAQARPPSPAPTMTTLSVGPVTVRMEFLRSDAPFKRVSPGQVRCLPFASRLLPKLV
jgi:hypothetical protein